MHILGPVAVTAGQQDYASRAAAICSHADALGLCLQT